METLLEPIKYIIPSLVVFATVYYLFRAFLSQQYNLEALRHNQVLSKDSYTVKLQALERLTMFSARLDVDNLYYRLISSDIGPKELQSAMLIAIQQEFEHNASQQLYISDNLWQIITLAKDHSQDAIATANGETNIEFLKNIHKILGERKSNPSQFAASAIKNEASLILGK
jgi:hypothetical protein